MIQVVNVHGKVMSQEGIVTLGNKEPKKVVVEEEFAEAPDIESLVEGQKEAIGLKPVEEFGEDKDALEAYGKEFGIDLSKRKTIENMYKDLVEFVNK